MDKFNMFIDMHQLQEWRRSKQRYTRSNKQINHVMVTLDKVLMTSKWEEKHPLWCAGSKHMVGSDHCPIILDTGEGCRNKQRNFDFEK
jgi:hypothetical protein